MSSSEPESRATKHAHGIRVAPTIAVEWRDRDGACQMVATRDEVTEEQCGRDADYLVAYELGDPPREPGNVLTCRSCWPHIDEHTVEPQGSDAEDGGES